MSDTIIKLENISKQYRLGTVGTKTLRGDLQRWWYKLSGKEDPTLKIGATNQLDTQEGEYVWALRDINLEVKQGEVLGIIGKNGAGKSTLLKLLSRVTGPTTGQIKVKGRIASLLEVGTGFHPELTGRENIFLNGAILGMSKPEIRSKFDEIVDFAGVAKYIDTPVKRYSSGMYVRLAFAVAAHLEPDILVVDEVLAVGDAEFQKKAIGKMQDVSTQGGRTVLFVSHNMASVQKLCSRAILMNNGKISLDGAVLDIVNEYLRSDDIFRGKNICLVDVPRKRFQNEIIFEEVWFNKNPIPYGEKVILTLKLKSLKSKKYKDLDFGIAVSDRAQKNIIHCSNRFIKKTINHSNDKSKYVFLIDNNLSPGDYLLTLFLRTEEAIQDWLSNIIEFTILDGNPYAYSDSKEIKGIVFPEFSIEVHD